MKPIFSAFVSVIAVTFLISSALADDGVTDKSIKFGQTAAITGPSAVLGIGMRDGIQAAFDEVNRAGGVHGRMLKLITLDDGYEPEITAININKLIDEEKVFATIGAIGTPTSYVSAPIACKQNIPFIGPFSGADFLREMDCVVNIRGTYCQEAEMWIEHLTEKFGSKRIALLYQDGAVGRAGKACVNNSLKKRGIEGIVGEGTYKRNTEAVKGAVIRIKRSKPDAIVTFATHRTAALFIKTSRDIGLNVPVLNLSFTGGKEFSKELGNYTKDVFVSRVVPLPSDKKIPFVKEYRDALKVSNSALEPDFVSMEGYLSGRLAVIALKKAGKDLTRKSFLSSFSGTHDLGGIKMTYDMPKDNQGMDGIFLTLIKPDGSFEMVETLK